MPPMRAYLVPFVACAAGALLACAHDTRPSTPEAIAPKAPAEWVSDPDEYHDHGISSSAGEAYFARLGGGDPYATGIAYPVWLALVEGFPTEMGGDVDASPTASASSSTALPTRSCRSGFHLTTTRTRACPSWS